MSVLEQAPGSMESHVDASARDWRDTIPDERRRPLRFWLWSVAAMTFGVLVVGGITRLTLSGLSIVHWDPIMGAIPPLGDAQWQQAFDLYRQSPDYAWRQGMTLADFKVIYFWEYLHRLLARTIGLVFLVPFVIFLVRGWLTRPLLARTLALFGLGALQGVMGWLMVMSGLVDRPSVSHYRLAAHLSLAFLIFGYALWLARDIANRRAALLDDAQRRLLLKGLGIVGVVLAVQIVWGAFVAGLRAGKYYPTFPLMGGRLVPGELLSHESVLHNFVANPIAVQWAHRVIGTVLAVLVIGLFVVVRKRIDDRVSRSFSAALLLLIAAQYALGIATLVLLVPVSLGVIHQATALVVFGVWLMWLHHAVHGGAVTIRDGLASRSAAAQLDPA